MWSLSLVEHPGKFDLSDSTRRKRSVVGTTRHLVNGIRASVFSIGDTENGIAGGGERHTPDAQVITASSR
jgi:hypothetical protein